MRRPHVSLSLIAALALAVAGCHAQKRTPAADPTSALLSVHQELDLAHAKDARAFMRLSIDEVMALRTPDFQWVDASGASRSELETEAWLARLFARREGIDDVESTIEGLEGAGDGAG